MASAGIGTIVSLVGAGLGAIGSFAQASAQKSAYEYQAAAASANARQIEQANAFNVDRLRADQRRFMSQQRAAFAKAGVALDEGSPLAVLADTAAQAEVDVQALRWEGASAAAAERIAAGGYRMKAVNAGSGGFYGAATSLLSGDWQNLWQSPSGPSPTTWRPLVAGYGSPR